MSKGQVVKDKILKAAMEVLREGGVKQLSQPKVAKAAGVRQSHLTYYFPKKIDLVAALMQGHIEYANEKLDALKKGGESEDLGGALDTLVNDRKRMRFFLGLIVEADEDPKIRKLVSAHVKQFNCLVCHYFQRPENDPDVEAFLNTLRGFGLMNLLKSRNSKKINVKKLAQQFGLS